MAHSTYMYACMHSFTLWSMLLYGKLIYLWRWIWTVKMNSPKSTLHPFLHLSSALLLLFCMRDTVWRPSSFLHHAVPHQENDYLSRCWSCTAITHEERLAFVLFEGFWYEFIPFGWTRWDCSFKTHYSVAKITAILKGRSIIKYNLHILIIRILLIVSFGSNTLQNRPGSTVTETSQINVP